MAKVVKEPAQFRAALEAASRVFAAAGLTWWIQDGTLLGAVRNGGPIPGDCDIDVGIHAADFRPSLIDLFKAAGFTLKKTRGVDDNRPLMLRAVFGGVSVDIFGMYQQGEHWQYTVAHRGILIANIFRPFAIGRIGFLGLDVPCPDSAEDFLVSEYGPEWRTPVSDWHYAFSPPNLRPIGGPFTRVAYRLHYLRWRMVVAMRRGRRVPAIAAEVSAT